MSTWHFKSLPTLLAVIVMFHLGSAASFRVGVPSFGFEYNEEPVLLFDNGLRLPPNSTAHATISVPNSQNITARFVGSIGVVFFEVWMSCYKYGFLHQYLARKLFEAGAVAAVIETKAQFNFWISSTSVVYLDGIKMPIIWFFANTPNTTSIIKRSIAMNATATITPPHAAAQFFSATEKMASLASIYQKLFMALWVLLIVATGGVLILRMRAERALKQRGVPTALLRLALFFIIILCVVRIVEKIDSYSSYGIIPRAWSISSALNLMGTCLVSSLVCISAWWGMIVASQAKVSKVRPIVFHKIAAGSIVVIWISCIANFVADSIVFFQAIIWAAVVVAFIIASLIFSMIFGILFLLRLSRSRQFERKNKVHHAGSNYTSLCCGRFELSRIEMILLRMATFIIIIFACTVAFVILFGLIQTSSVPYVIVFICYDALAILVSVSVNAMVFVAPKAKKKHRSSGRSDSDRSRGALIRSRSSESQTSATAQVN